MPPTKLETDCIEYAGHKLPTGYGNRKFRGRMMSAHRAAWIEANGAIPDGLCVLHRCDNRPCVNTEHLFLGTQKENMQDASKKGRLSGSRNAGERNPSSRLTQSDVDALRSLRASTGMSYARLGEKFGVATMTAWLAVNGKTWA